MPSIQLLVGTRKGVFTLSGSAARDSWSLEGPFVAGLEVNHAVLDPRTGMSYATANDPWFGPVVRYRVAGDETWVDARKSPRFSGDPQPSVEGEEQVPWFARESTVIERVWAIQPGPSDQPGVMYAGVAPAALFSSRDGGVTWQENEALSNHPTRPTWVPGAGGMALHSIVLDPANASRMWIAISSAGVFRTEDGGKSWEPTCQGIRSEQAEFDPNIPLYPEHGQCVHHVEHAAGANDRLYAQSHLGTYRSDNGGDSWVDITPGLPSQFGLAMTVHPHDPETAYVVPLVGGEFRCPPGGRLAVWRTRDAGANWAPLSNGLPEENAYMGVYRQSLCTDVMDPAGIYFGTNTGQLYASADEGESWKLITQNLPPIESVSANVLD
ncbi:MAG: exo-alpha-sialidase [bacterium]